MPGPSVSSCLTSAAIDCAPEAESLDQSSVHFAPWLCHAGPRKGFLPKRLGPLGGRSRHCLSWSDTWSLDHPDAVPATRGASGSTAPLSPVPPCRLLSTQIEGFARGGIRAIWSESNPWSRLWEARVHPPRHPMPGSPPGKRSESAGGPSTARRGIPPTPDPVLPMTTRFIHRCLISDLNQPLVYGFMRVD